MLDFMPGLPFNLFNIKRCFHRPISNRSIAICWHQTNVE